MPAAQRFIIAAFVLAAVLASAALGAFASLDRLLADARFALTNRAPSGQVVFADIDASSLARVGVWPWPREIHAQLLDRLMAAGAAEVAFDIDFSTRSNPQSDADFAAALEAAGGYALLAAFEQVDSAGERYLNRPIDAFAAHATAAAVNVKAGPDGRIESIPVRAQDVAAMPILLSAITPDRSDIVVDFGIDLRAVDRIPVADILADSVDPARLADRQVVIGASAIELRDIFSVPRYGSIAGPLLQIAGVETLRAGRNLMPLGQWPGALAAIGLAGILAMFGGGLRIWPSLGLTLGAIALGEVLAFAAQALFGVTVQTAGFVVAMLFLFGLHVALGFAVEFARRRRAEAQLVYLARHDPVTALPSRLRLIERIGEGAAGPILLVALTRLDLVRGTLGRAIADAALKQVAQRLSGLGADLVAIVDRDVFALVLPVATSAGEMDSFGREARRVLRPRFAVEEHEVHVDAVLAASPADPDVSAELRLQRAELALQTALARQSGGVTGFVPAMENDVARRRLVDAALRQAIERGELNMVFQPQSRLSDGALVGVEALVRWTSPELGAVSPTEFIPLAEETGLIVPLGRFVLLESCRAARRWNWTGTLSVNVSAAQLKLTDVAETVADVLQQTGFPAGQLDLEITESVLVDGADQLQRTLSALKGLGVGIAIDDFGTGYSSLSYLSQLSFDKLKVDQSFVRQLTSSPAEAAIVRTVIELAQRLDKITVAEGLETEEQLLLLKDMGCDIGQGWLIGKPMPAEEITARLDVARGGMGSR